MESTTLNSWKTEYQEILNKIYYLSKKVNGANLQKLKFSFLVYMFQEMWKNRRIIEKVKDLTGLIILYLNLYKSKYPLDIFSSLKKNADNKKSNTLELKQLLRSEIL